jgi:hypothetical protein
MSVVTKRRDSPLDLSHDFDELKYRVDAIISCNPNMDGGIDQNE